MLSLDQISVKPKLISRKPWLLVSYSTTHTTMLATAIFRFFSNCRFSTNRSIHCGDRHAGIDPETGRSGAPGPSGDRGGLQLGQGLAGVDWRYPRHRAH